MSWIVKLIKLDLASPEWNAVAGLGLAFAWGLALTAIAVALR